MIEYRISSVFEGKSQIEKNKKDLLTFMIGKPLLSGTAMYQNKTKQVFLCDVMLFFSNNEAIYMVSTCELVDIDNRNYYLFCWTV